MIPTSIYLDHAATTPVHPEVANVLAQHLTREGLFANPASRSHQAGWLAERAVEQARIQVALLLNADPREIIWTSGATESNNLALKGVCEAHEAPPGHIVTSQTEHKAVLDVARYLRDKHGWALSELKPAADGLVDIKAVLSSLRPDTHIVSLMWVNNETGVIQDIAAIGAALRDRGVLFHVDAAQAVGKVDIDVVRDCVDLLSVSAHKFYGPKGVGALYVRRSPSIRVCQQIHGGGQERGMRSGTLATHQIVGLGEAARLAAGDRQDNLGKVASFASAFLEPLQNLIESGRIRRIGTPVHCYPGILNLAFENLDSDTLMAALPELAVASGSACTSASVEPSHVLVAMGLPRQLALAAVRFSFGLMNTAEEAARAGELVAQATLRLRGDGL